MPALAQITYALIVWDVLRLVVDEHRPGCVPWFAFAIGRIGRVHLLSDPFRGRNIAAANRVESGSACRYRAALFSGGVADNCTGNIRQACRRRRYPAPPVALVDPAGPVAPASRAGRAGRVCSCSRQPDYCRMGVGWRRSRSRPWRRTAPGRRRPMPAMGTNASSWSSDSSDFGGKLCPPLTDRRRTRSSRNRVASRDLPNLVQSGRSGGQPPSRRRRRVRRGRSGADDSSLAKLPQQRGGHSSTVELRVVVASMRVRFPLVAFACAPLAPWLAAGRRRFAARSSSPGKWS